MTAEKLMRMLAVCPPESELFVWDETGWKPVLFGFEGTHWSETEGVKENFTLSVVKTLLGDRADGQKDKEEGGRCDVC